jgi:hypothetical protein
VPCARGLADPTSTSSQRLITGKPTFGFSALAVHPGTGGACATTARATGNRSRSPWAVMMSSQPWGSTENSRYSPVSMAWSRRHQGQGAVHSLAPEYGNHCSLNALSARVQETLAGSAGPGRLRLGPAAVDVGWVLRKRGCAGGGALQEGCLARARGARRDDKRFDLSHLKTS